MAIKTLLYSFNLGDVDDPQIYAGIPLYEWQQSEAGKWCMEHCIETPIWQTYPDSLNWGYKVVVTGLLTETDHTFFHLKYVNPLGR